MSDNVINLADRRKAIVSSEEFLGEGDFDEVVLLRLFFKEKRFVGTNLNIENVPPQGVVLSAEDLERYAWATLKAQYFVTEKMLALKGAIYTDGTPIRVVYGYQVYGNGYSQIYGSMELTPDPHHLEFLDRTSRGCMQSLYEIVGNNVEETWLVSEDREPCPDTDFEDYPGKPSRYDERARDFGSDPKVVLGGRPLGSLT
jgi:hypothetical protein